MRTHLWKRDGASDQDKLWDGSSRFPSLLLRLSCCRDVSYTESEAPAQQRTCPHAERGEHAPVFTDPTSRLRPRGILSLGTAFLPETFTLGPCFSFFLLEFSAHCLNWGRARPWRGRGREWKGKPSPQTEGASRKLILTVAIYHSGKEVAALCKCSLSPTLDGGGQLRVQVDLHRFPAMACDRQQAATNGLTRTYPPHTHTPVWFFP